MAFGEINDPTTILLIVSVVIIACAIVIYGMTRRIKKPKSPQKTQPEPESPKVKVEIKSFTQPAPVEQPKPEEKLDWAQSTLVLTVTYLPETDPAVQRKVMLGLRANNGLPIMRMSFSGEIGIDAPIFGEMFNELKQQFTEEK